MTWYQSLYWRIALGFVGCLALLLVVQALLFVFVVARSGRAIANQPPDRLAQTMAADVAALVEREPTADIDAFLRKEYAGDVQPFFVVLADGSTLEYGGPFDRSLTTEARARFDAMRRFGIDRLGRGRGRFGGPPFGPGRGGDFQPPPPYGRADSPGAAPPPDRPAGDSRGAPRDDAPDFPRRAQPALSGLDSAATRPMRPAPILVGDQWVGLVVVPPGSPFSHLLARYAPLLAVVALVTLIIGASVAAVTIFGPARSRLRAVEDAARRLGAGDLSARAPLEGRDEVTAVARAFNTMASDLSARAEALAASDRARRQLLADVSHELTTPITSMRGYLETLTMPSLTLDADTRTRYMSIVADETHRLEHIVGDLLELARLEGGGGAFRPERVDIESVFERVRARHERSAQAQQVEIRCHSSGTTVWADKAKLEQAVQNLAANALRYAPTGTAIALSATAAPEGGVTIVVEDRGVGIASEHQPHVFDRFYRADASRTRASSNPAEGTGLGLSIVKAIVERHGGRVTLDSVPGSTRIALHFPAEPATAV